MSLSFIIHAGAALTFIAGAGVIGWLLRELRQAHADIREAIEAEEALTSCFTEHVDQMAAERDDLSLRLGDVTSERDLLDAKLRPFIHRPKDPKTGKFTKCAA